MNRWFLAFAVLASGGLVGCDDDDEGGGDDAGGGGAGGAGAACSMVAENAQVEFTSITKDPASDAACPELTVEQLNSGGEGGEGGDGCEPVIDLANCQATLNCPEDGLTGSFSVQNDGFSGSFTVMVEAVSCEYTFEGTVR